MTEMEGNIRQDDKSELQVRSFQHKVVMRVKGGRTDKQEGQVVCRQLLQNLLTNRLSEVRTEKHDGRY